MQAMKSLKLIVLDVGYDTDSIARFQHWFKKPSHHQCYTYQK